MIIVAGDLHMGLKDLGHRTGDSMNTFRQLLAIASDLSRKYNTTVPVILAGDIWDSTNVHPEVFQYAARMRFRFEDVPLYYIDGNHDKISPSWTELIGAEELRPDKLTEVLPGVNVMGIPWNPPNAFKEILADSISKNKPDLLIVHQFIEDCEDSMIQTSIPASVFKDIECPVIAGDIHQEITVGKNVIYTSCTNRRTVNQPSGSYLVVMPHAETPMIEIGDEPATLEMTYGGFDIYRVKLFGRAIKFVKIAGRFEMEDIEKVPMEDPDGWPPYVVLMADSFDTEAVKRLNELAKDNIYIIYRKNNVDIIEDEDTEEEKFVLEGSREYARRALKDYPVSDGAKELALSMIEDEDTFFASLKENFNL